MIKAGSVVRDTKGIIWTVQAVFSQKSGGGVLVEHFRRRKDNEPPEVCGALVAEIKQEEELTQV